MAVALFGFGPVAAAQTLVLALVLATLTVGTHPTSAEGSGSTLIVDKAHVGEPLDAIGGLSGGGATSRLLIDYKEPQRSQILDYLFKPNFGASLHLLKVEIGGDSQSTDGTEPSHMHSKDDLDYKRGYEWWLMTEAKKRNPNIKLYGLAWAYPGWVGNGTSSPFSYPNLTADYISKWLQGAKSVYGLDVDYIGIWNERSSDATYVKTLRRTLDDAGFKHTQIVAKDGGADICNTLAKDKSYADAVSVIGLHYPSDFSDYSQCYALNKPLWASEESSSYDDLNGAACWARVITSHWALSRMTASIMWNLVGAYYHGTNWYASSMMTAVQPWSGHYWVSPVVWATAHVTQFTRPGWLYLNDSYGSGSLPNGGYYATLVDPNSSDFTITVVKIDHDHAPCTRPALPPFDVHAETVTFKLAPSMGGSSVPALAVWYSNFQNETQGIFKRLSDVHVGTDGTFSVHVPVGAMYTISTIRDGPQKGSHGPPPPSAPSFPLPYADAFDEVAESQEGKYLADQIGAFEVHADAQGNKVLRQMVPELPIGWSDHGSNGPVTVIGMREWQDVFVQVKVRLSSNITAHDPAACVAARVDQMWDRGIVFCVYASGNYTLSIGGPKQSNGQPADVVSQGQLPTPIHRDHWHTISITCVNSSASGMFDSGFAFRDVAVPALDTGFAAIGTNGWFAVEYDALSISEAGHWVPPAPKCANPKRGDKLGARPCATNGFNTTDQLFTLRADWTLVHDPTGLCAQAAGTGGGAAVALAACDPSNPMQQFKNDYTRVRNTEMPVFLDGQNPVSAALTGTLAGGVSVGGNGDWATWSYFPNTHQLRNQYTAKTNLGFPMCLTVMC
ncbi:galactocerebrosidase [Salpingoeca rosetta]|uniref:galactosylceramidase n=1 Tax=Salpingoeca rosetta (strain ATCC 50818 / BSB-021) TaxID=946362 RepID=F2TVZ9_SALR5|nr:galactocerebrosidase [Salpingoeca rosetta]EGD72245.1 galactocerebrosidase [Salpingoeca rosetta]|eukprot:XP_004998816.1 galactocerebrosidase [Salpingoeca rosetta]